MHPKFAKFCKILKPCIVCITKTQLENYKKQLISYKTVTILQNKQNHQHKTLLANNT